MFNFLREALNPFKTNQPNINNAAEQYVIVSKGDDNASGGIGVKSAPTTSHFKRNVDVNMTGRVQELVNLTTKYPYSRPSFIELSTNDELLQALNHSARYVILPKRSCLPRNAGYAECTNAGKSYFNEDQATAIQAKVNMVSGVYGNASTISDLNNVEIFAIFDGHAGADVSNTTAHELPHRIKDRLSDVMDEIKAAYEANIVEDEGPQTLLQLGTPSLTKKKLTLNRLVTGAIEAAFHDMDDNLVADETNYCVKGGCAAILSMFYAERLFVANAGDSRAVMFVSGELVPMSTDFTPELERRRLQLIAENHPHLLGNEFCSRQFVQRVTRKDVGTEMLYRDSRMEGWANRLVTEEDLRFPMIIGEGKRARLLATIGLTRGLGDHNLKVFDSNVKIKPFLSPSPETKIYDLRGKTFTPDDVLVIASDGLWDVVSNEDALHLVQQVLAELPVTDKTRYIVAAQRLIEKARGQLKKDKKDIWVLQGTDDYASHDDISCFVIPLLDSKFVQETPAEPVNVESAETSCNGNLDKDSAECFEGEREDESKSKTSTSQTTTTVTCEGLEHSEVEESGCQADNNSQEPLAIEGVEGDLFKNSDDNSEAIVCEISSQHS